MLRGVMVLAPLHRLHVVVREQEVRLGAKGTPSFGFRPGLGQHDALAAVDENARKGFRWVVDADIQQFFDKLDHQQLMTALRRRISDGEVLRLIYRWLKAGYLWEVSATTPTRAARKGRSSRPYSRTCTSTRSTAHSRQRSRSWAVWSAMRMTS